MMSVGFLKKLTGSGYSGAGQTELTEIQECDGRVVHDGGRKKGAGT